jgi:phosphatidylserine/phosphatidylglycerophosphate/cardiolipin synthase-like enzyme
MPVSFQLSSSVGGLTVKAYRSDGSVLLAFDLDQSNPTLTQNLAGFAIQCTPPSGPAYWLKNRLTFDSNYTQTTKVSAQTWTNTNLAPIQKFRWSDFPWNLSPGGLYTYTVSAMYFDPAGGPLITGPTTSVTFDFLDLQDAAGKYEVGFTRGDLASQAYINANPDPSIWPGEMQGKPRTADFDTTPFQAKYAWLGFHARPMVFNFINDCVQQCQNDPTMEVHLFAYDLDEPDFVRALQSLKGQLKAILDNALLHTKPGALEIGVAQLLKQSAGPDNIHQGHFQRFAHDKVIILVKNGVAVKVLTGSANFSIRGLYVQANNVLVFNDPSVAGLYEQTFQDSWKTMGKFASSGSAKQWWPVNVPGIPPFKVAFSPHDFRKFNPLVDVHNAILGAKKNVLFAVMELAGGNTEDSGSAPANAPAPAASAAQKPQLVIDLLKNLYERKDIFSFGITQSAGGLNMFTSSSPNGEFADFAYLQGKLPPPFSDEFGGGPGQVIHDKFVVVDFNGDNPVVFTGSSNLAEGGEQDNGDNLLMMTDPDIVTAYAVEAIRLVDHYHFRQAMHGATDDNPLNLQGPGVAKPWWADYYDPTNAKFNERLVLAK